MIKSSFTGLYCDILYVSVIFIVQIFILSLLFRWNMDVYVPSSIMRFNDRKETINVHIVGMNGSLSPSPLIYCWHFELEEFLNCVHVITIKLWQIHDMKFNLWIYFDISTVSYAKFEISMCNQRIGIAKIKYGGRPMHLCRNNYHSCVTCDIIDSEWNEAAALLGANIITINLNRFSR